jgi:hypothetical protein
MYRTIAHIVLLVEMRAATVEPLARSSTLCGSRVLSMYRTTVHIVLLVEMMAATVGLLEYSVWEQSFINVSYTLYY